MAFSISSVFSLHLVPVEVLARVRSQLRRYDRLGSKPETVDGNLTVGGVTLDDRTKSVTVDETIDELVATLQKLMK